MRCFQLFLLSNIVFLCVIYIFVRLNGVFLEKLAVAPRAGVWIETLINAINIH